MLETQTEQNQQNQLSFFGSLIMITRFLNYRAEMITSERNTIVNRIFLRKFSTVVNAMFPSQDLPNYCASSGTNTNQAVGIVVFPVPRTLEK